MLAQQISLIEKVSAALDCLASGTDSFEDRLYNAHISALRQLDLGDAPPEIAKDLRWVLEFCKRHQTPDGAAMSEVSESDRHKIVSKLIRILTNSSGGLN